jgi:hypothetical protein
MSPILHRAPQAHPHDATYMRAWDAGLLKNPFFRIGVVFALLHVIVAWLAFSYEGYDPGPASVGAAVSSDRSTAALSTEDRISRAGDAVSESIDLLYAELPVRMSDQEWRRDIVSACTMMGSRADELAALLPDESERGEMHSVLVDMSAAADALRAAVDERNPEAAESALQHMNASVNAWEAELAK